MVVEFLLGREVLIGKFVVSVKTVVKALDVHSTVDFGVFEVVVGVLPAETLVVALVEAADVGGHLVAKSRGVVIVGVEMFELVVAVDRADAAATATP